MPPGAHLLGRENKDQSLFTNGWFNRNGLRSTNLLNMSVGSCVSDDASFPFGLALGSLVRHQRTLLFPFPDSSDFLIRLIAQATPLSSSTYENSISLTVSHIGLYWYACQHELFTGLRRSLGIETKVPTLLKDHVLP